MTVKVIELNDRAIRISDESGLLVQSPGFALVDGKQLLLGDQAEQQARLKPTSAFNKYWQELSLDPIGAHHDRFRHHADIAHAQLLQLAEQANIDHDVIFAVPGSFSRQQLAILLGLAKHSPLNPVAVVDAALAAMLTAASEAPSDSLIYVDQQLHQVVLTRLVRRDGQLHRDALVQVPGTGSQQFMDAMMKLATSQFIQQCRFNPQHNAESEQQLYNTLPAWLGQDEQEGNLILELNSAASVYTAKLPRQSLINSLAGLYRKIAQEIDALARGSGEAVLLSEALASLPGLAGVVGEGRQLATAETLAAHTACLSHAAQLAADMEQGLHLVTALPLIGQGSRSAVPAETPAPTHALLGAQAYALNGLTIHNQQAGNGSASSSGLSVSAAGLPATLGRIEKRGDRLYFRSEAAPFQVNNRHYEGGEEALALGDRLQFPGSAESIQLIRVNHE